MKKGQDPALIFEQTSAIKNQCNASSRLVAQDDLFDVVIDTAPRECQAVLANEQLRLGSTLDIEHLEKAMNLHCRAIGKDHKNQDDDDKEAALNAFTARRSDTRLVSDRIRRTRKKAQVKTESIFRASATIVESKDMSPAIAGKRKKTKTRVLNG
jgi:hypothetical protein